MADLDGSDTSPPESQASNSQYKSEDGRVSSATCPSSSGSGQTYTPNLTPTPAPAPNRPATSSSPNNSNNNAAPKTDSLLFNKIDERQRLARERREEREKQNAVKEAQWQAREERARQHYEKHLEERRRKLEEQRVKEDKRRAAVEEKRRQKLEEDRVRHEAVMRRTLERSQKTRQKTNRWSWGGALHTNTPSTPADADRRSVSTMNLSKHADPVITKRLSSSSATLLHSPDRGLRRLPLTPWESNIVHRLQQPTHSYLARSRSAMSLSGDQTGMLLAALRIFLDLPAVVSEHVHNTPLKRHFLCRENKMRNVLSVSLWSKFEFCLPDGLSSPPAQRPSAGTTDPEEASRILAENRRLAREQREREEEERKQQEEQARYAGRHGRRTPRPPTAPEVSTSFCTDWRRRRWLGVRRRSERRERRRLSKEEEESRQREEAEKLRQEREKHFQKQEAERLERKKRLEEIMKRTRRSDTTEKVKGILDLNQSNIELKNLLPVFTLCFPLSSPESQERRRCR
uniref:Microtubule-associated protein 7a n=1 Tax=Salarias fasciatus TaxID=181472 RepID=A0A672FY37_SALFA